MANAAWGTDKQWGAKWNSKATPYIHFTEKDPEWASKFHIWRMDWDETEWERRAFADKMANRLGVPLNELKTVAPSRRDGIIFVLHDGGYTVREIERYTGISKSTVSRIVRAYARVKAQAEGSE